MNESQLKIASPNPAENLTKITGHEQVVRVNIILKAGKHLYPTQIAG